MGSILFLTNMEQQYAMMNRAKEDLAAELPEDAAARLLNDAEPWSGAWEKAFRGSDMVLFTWMGTGLNTKFLKQASEYMQQHKIRHLYLVPDPGDDVLEYGLTPEETQTIRQYISFSGAANYRNLWLWMSRQFCRRECRFDAPRPLPWNGIYHPRAQAPFTDVAEYRRQFCLPDRPTIALLFPREDWVWGSLACEQAVIAEIER
ncbi:MAG TPA: cobaltochelatase subunit CobN, partial [Negativicutes bacterium]|nr:cobaltochelatase subunit CobN [Negativicutes bacterium]